MKLLLILLFTFTAHAQFRANIENLSAANQRLEAKDLEKLQERIERFKKHPSKKGFRWQKNGEAIEGFKVTKIPAQYSEDGMEIVEPAKEVEEKAVVITIEDITPDPAGVAAKGKKRQDYEALVQRLKSGESLNSRELSELLRNRL